MTARGPPTFDDGLTNTGARGVFAVAWTRRLCENARQIQAANWRAASSFPLVNYLPVAPRVSHVLQTRDGQSARQRPQRHPSGAAHSAARTSSPTPSGLLPIRSRRGAPACDLTNHPGRPPLPARTRSGIAADVRARSPAHQTAATSRRLDITSALPR
jgi:hypothetical protein